MAQRRAVQALSSVTNFTVADVTNLRARFLETVAEVDDKGAVHAQNAT